MNPSTQLLDQIATSWCARNRPESMNTDWGQSLLAYGLLAAVRRTGNAEAREYLRRWITYHLGAGVHVTYFVGSWSIGLLFPEIIELFPEYRLPLENLAEEIYDFILQKAIRNGDGVLLHNVDLPHIYVDTIYYSAPVLGKLGGVLNRTDWVEDAMHQLRTHLEILNDPETGFSIHCQENRSGKRSEGAWARGNGWVVMTCAELLRTLPRESVEWHEAGSILLNILTALAPYQAESGLWRTIITDETSYEESSASAMYLFGILRGCKEGILPKSFREIAERASRGLAACADAEGKFLYTSEGTWPGTIEYYKSLATGEWWWGTGAYLLALGEEA